MFRRSFVVVAVLLVTPLLSPLLPTDDVSEGDADLTLRLIKQKNQYVLHESVMFVYAIENPTAQEICFQGRPEMGIRWLVEGPDKKVRRQEGRGIEVCDASHPDVCVEAQSAVHYTAEMVPSKLPVVGEYVIQAELFVGGLNVTALESNKLRIAVTEPAGADMAAMEFFGSRDEFVKLMHRGPVEYCRGRNAAACFEDLRQFLEEHRQSAYAPQVTWLLASSVGHGFLDIEPRSELSEGLFRQFLLEWADHPAAPRVMYGLTMMLDDAGRYGEAAEALAEFEKRFPERVDRARALRNNLTSGEMVAPK